MTRLEKITELEIKVDHINEELRNGIDYPARFALMITKEVYKAQIHALQWTFDDESTASTSSATQQQLRQAQLPTTASTSSATQHPTPNTQH